MEKKLIGKNRQKVTKKTRKEMTQMQMRMRKYQKMRAMDMRIKIRKIQRSIVTR